MSNELSGKNNRLEYREKERGKEGGGGGGGGEGGRGKRGRERERERRESKRVGGEERERFVHNQIG